MKELLGTDSPPIRRFAIAWAALGGWVLSSTVFLIFVRDAGVLMLLALIPGLLSAAAVERATNDSKETGGSIVGLSVLASVVCPFVTGLVCMFFALFGSNAITLDVFFGVVCVGGGVGGFFAAPLGLLFGVIYSVVWASLDATRATGRASLEGAWMVFGLAFVLLSALVAVVATISPVLWPSHGMDLRVPLAVGTLAFGLITFARGLWMRVRRRRLARRAVEGMLEGWSVVPADTLDGVEDLPKLFARDGGRVLVRRAANARGPFRTSEAVEPVARL